MLGERFGGFQYGPPTQLRGAPHTRRYTNVQVTDLLSNVMQEILRMNRNPSIRWQKGRIETKFGDALDRLSLHGKICIHYFNYQKYDSPLLLEFDLEKGSITSGDVLGPYRDDPETLRMHSFYGNRFGWEEQDYE